MSKATQSQAFFLEKRPTMQSPPGCMKTKDGWIWIRIWFWMLIKGVPIFLPIK